MSEQEIETTQQDAEPGRATPTRAEVGIGVGFVMGTLVAAVVLAAFSIAADGDAAVAAIKGPVALTTIGTSIAGILWGITAVVLGRRFGPILQTSATATAVLGILLVLLTAHVNGAIGVDSEQPADGHRWAVFSVWACIVALALMSLGAIRMPKKPSIPALICAAAVPIVSLMLYLHPWNTDGSQAAATAQEFAAANMVAGGR